MEITSAVIAMSHKLNLKVLAEGVETLEQMQFLRENNCDFAQGFLISPPLPMEALVELYSHEEALSIDVNDKMLRHETQRHRSYCCRLHYLKICVSLATPFSNCSMLVV